MSGHDPRPPRRLLRPPTGPLRHRGFRYFLAARFSSVLGNAIAPIAVAFAVLDLTDSPLALGFVLAARTVPNVTLILFGGVAADRFRRETVLLASNTLCALTQAAAATLLITGAADVWHIAAIEAVNGVAAAFTMPAMASMVPQLVNRDELRPANALSGLTRNAAMVGGGTLAGVVVGFAGSGWGLAVNAAAFAVAALFVARLRLPAREHGGVRPSTVRELREGWREFVSRRWVWVVVVAFCVINAVYAGGFGTLGPLVADEALGRVAWGALASAQAVGLILGALLMLRWRPDRPLVAGMAAILCDVPMLVALGAFPHFGVLMVVFVLSGLGHSVFGINWESTLQAHIPPDRLSRVVSYDMLGSFVALPVGQLAAGPLAARFGPEEVLVAGGFIVAVFGLAVLLEPSVRRVRGPESRAPETV
ncbi:MFS transporter [Stackebrandtia albiflava]|uniref:MFS transporter n=1 Tax=Stackebrandtia albiflava TaxID=406432 RepID=UPI0013155DB3|nr:MFS transporter [Stackebrandtia albiflava]